ncbi:hypothetical protein [Peribacillus sp. NPDC101480]
MEVQEKSHIQVTGGRFVIFNGVIEKIDYHLVISIIQYWMK